MVRRINISADTSYEVLMANTSQHAYNANGERVHQLPYSDSDPFHHANNLSEPVGTVGIDGISHSELDYTCSPLVLTKLDVLTHQNILLEAIEQSAPVMTLEQNVYFYHGDHLGSANWITDADGKPIQYIHYAPYGEQIANPQTIGYDERFKFTGKERDWETGYDYFGARFYDHRKGIWNSVDPLADKYPGNTPYLYCGGNPIKYVDPDGRRIVIGSWWGRALAKIGINNFEAKTQRRLQYLKSISPELNKAITTMETRKDVTVRIFSMSQLKKDYPTNTDIDFNKGMTITDGINSSIYYNEDVGFLVDGGYSSPEAILAHELGHAENNMNGTSVEYDRKEARKRDGSVVEKQKGNANEKNSIFYENQVRQQESEPARSYDYYKVNKEK